MAAKKGSQAGADTSLLHAALMGYEQTKRDIEEKLASLQRRLGFGGATEAPVPRRTMSAGARKKIAAAQKKRWALAKINKTEPGQTKSKNAKPKSTMSAAGRRRISVAQKKRWAALKTKKKAAK